MDPGPVCPLRDRKASILRGVDLALWGPYLDDAKLDTALAAIDALGDAGRLAPPEELVFEPLRYGGPADVVAVAIGQDPYAEEGTAQGLCFSVPGGRPLPESLKRIYGCLDRAGLRAAHATPKGGKAPVSGDLRPWAVQGVLMINAALTTRLGVRRAHADEWEPFVGEFLGRLCALTAAAGRRLHFLLWGGDARAYAPLARRHGHVVHEYSHPSPTADNRLPEGARFRMCPHFEEVNAALAAERRRPIVWDNLAPIVAFTDGSSPLNGKPGARAAFAAVLAGGPFGGTVLRGEVVPREYAFLDDAAPELGLRVTDRPAAPTNNRAELLGIVHALLALLVGRALGNVEIVTDSDLCVKTLDVWLPARRRKGTAHELKNFDLLCVAERLLALLRAQAAAVSLVWVPASHDRPKPPADAPARDRLFHAGNDRADKLAGAVLKPQSGAGAPPTAAYAVEVTSGPAVLSRFTGAPGGLAASGAVPGSVP